MADCRDRSATASPLATTTATRTDQVPCVTWTDVGRARRRVRSSFVKQRLGRGHAVGHQGRVEGREGAGEDGQGVDPERVGQVEAQAIVEQGEAVEEGDADGGEQVADHQGD